MITKQDFVNRFGFFLAQALESSAPQKTGKLARAFPATMVVEGNKIKFTLPNYWKPVEYGSLPHEITAKNKEALFWKGARHPVKRVMHPGTKPTFFIRNTLNQAPHILKQTLDSFK